MNKYSRKSTRAIDKLKKEIAERKKAEKAIKGLLKKIERAKREWESTVDSLPDLVCMVVDRGRIVRANRVVEKWNIGKVLEVKDRRVHELLHPGCKSTSCYLNTFWKKAWDKAIRGKAVECEAYDKHLERHILVRVQPLKNLGGRTATGSAVVIVRDVTERKRAEQADQFKKLSEKLIDFQEEERKRVSRELHDEIGQLLTAIKLSLGMIEKDHAGLEKSIRRELRETIRLVDSGMDEVRKISARLRPEILDDFGLIPCVEQEVRYLAKRSGIKIEFTSGGLKDRLKPKQEIVLYRVVQEAINNIIKHGKATRAEVSIVKIGNNVMLKVKDNGKGFEISSQKSSHGLGILGMRERIASVGGELKISSQPGQGFLLEAEFSAARG